MGMGLRNSPSTLQSSTKKACVGMQEDELFIYMDDIVVHAANLEEYEKKMRRLLKKLDEANLTIEPKKCQVLHREASFLDHTVGNGVIGPDPKKIEAVAEFPVPTYKRKIQDFVGLTNYYRRFVKNYAKIETPMIHALEEAADSKTRTFAWGDGRQEAFEEIK